MYQAFNSLKVHKTDFMSNFVWNLWLAIAGHVGVEIPTNICINKLWMCIINACVLTSITNIRTYVCMYVFHLV